MREIGKYGGEKGRKEKWKKRKKAERKKGGM